MHVVFTADGSVESGGFAASYSSGSAGAVVPTPQPVAVPLVPATAGPASGPAASPGASPSGPCSGATTLSSSSGTITDGPANYSPNQNCQFTITTGSAISLSFSSLATEVNYDFVKVYDGP